MNFDVFSKAKHTVYLGPRSEYLGGIAVADDHMLCRRFVSSSAPVLDQ